MNEKLLENKKKLKQLSWTISQRKENTAEQKENGTHKKKN